MIPCIQQSLGNTPPSVKGTDGFYKIRQDDSYDVSETLNYNNVSSLRNGSEKDKIRTRTRPCASDKRVTMWKRREGF